MPDFTTTALLTSINNRALVPTSQTTYQTSDILALASEEVRSYIVPMIMKMRSEYFTYASPDVAIQANVSKYAIPYRAIGGKLRGVQLIDNAGNIFDFPLIEEEDECFFNYGSNTATSFAFKLEGNAVKITPPPTSNSGSFIRFLIYFRPNELVATSAAAQITAINTGTGQVTITAVPSTFSTGTSLDLINGFPGFECRAYDQTPTDITGAVITFATLPVGLSVGDWIALSGQTPIPQIPYDLHPLLAQSTAARLLESQGDVQGLELANAKLKQLEENAMHLLSPRTDGNAKKLINRYSTLRSWGYRRYSNY